MSATVFLFEWASGGGFLAEHVAFDPTSVFLQQGHRMLRALIEDFRHCGYPVRTMLDHRFSTSGLRKMSGTKVESVHDDLQFWRVFEESARQSQFALAIAPETDGFLTECCQRLAHTSAVTLTPQGSIVELTSSKHETSEWLENRGVQPRIGIRWECDNGTWPPPISLPAVVKPDDGAGGSRWLINHAWGDFPQGNLTKGRWRIERFLAGLSTSVVGIVNQQRRHWLVPMRQKLRQTADSAEYLGGEFPLTSEQSARVVGLADRALKTLPRCSGYLGMDIILSDEGPSQDCIVDINPRMTSSYLGLRKIYGPDLAQALVDNALGRKLDLSRKLERLSFDIDDDF